MHTRKLLLTIVVVVLLSALVSAADFSFSGTFNNVNQVQYITFTVSAGQHIVIRSYSYAGGTNSAGVLVPAGGFDPLLAVFQGTGNSASLLYKNDDAFECAHVNQDTVSHQCYDAYIDKVGALLDANTVVGGFDAGTYTLVVMNYANFAKGPTLGDGFTGGAGASDCFGAPRAVTGVFQDCTGLTRTGNWAVDLSGVDTAQLQIPGPSVVAVTPSTGTASSQIFHFTFADGSGYSSINSARVVFNSGISAVNGCMVLYTAASNSVALMNDAGTVFGPNQVLGVAGTVQNSQCSMDVGASSATGSGNNLLLNVALTFKPAFAGNKNVYGYAQNKFGLNSGFQKVGTWSLAAAAPSVSSVTPSTGGASNQIFQLAFADVSGYNSINSARVVFNSGLSAVNGCMVLYTAASNSIALMNDAGTVFGPNQVLGVAGTVQNTQCSMDVGASSATGSGNNLLLNVALTFKPAFAGNKNVYGYAQNKFGLNSGFQKVGTWSLAAAAPSVTSVTPSTGNGSSQAFQFAFTDGSGYSSINSARVVFNSGISAVNGCMVLYTAASNSVALMNDAGTVFGPNQVLGVAGTVQNSQCSMDVGASSAMGSGNNLLLNVALTFKPAFANKNVYGYAQNKFGLNSGFQKVGTWTAP